MLVFKGLVIIRCSFVDLPSRRPDIWLGSLHVKFSLNPPTVTFLLPGTSIFSVNMVPPTHHTTFARRTRGRRLAGCEKRDVLLWCNIQKKKFYLFDLQSDRFILYYFRRNFDSVFHKMWQMTQQISKQHYHSWRLKWTARKMMLCNQIKLPQNKKKLLIFVNYSITCILYKTPCFHDGVYILNYSC
jgi:hypothetical protein